ncbi:MAG TPA: ferritin-like domain-containing protein [Planctomycetaceae bacterium]|nr:ferritin-like domain-containing protein [Planctomycetaceae bacterium]
MSLDTLADAFYEELQDVLSAERQLVKALPKMAENATNRDLKKAIEAHLKETQEQVKRVEEAFSDTGRAARAKTCDAMKGLVAEAESALEESGESATKDAIIIACAQKVEHYEIATYGTLCTWADALGYKRAAKLLKLTMEEEEGADKLLTKLSAKINSDALAKV